MSYKNKKKKENSSCSELTNYCKEKETVFLFNVNQTAKILRTERNKCLLSGADRTKP